MYVLIIDDSSGVRRVLREHLERLVPGASIEEADDVLVARTRIAEGKLDVVFLDLDIHGMYGANLIEAIDASHPAAKIVVSTGLHREDPAVVDAMSMGAHGFLRKPLRLAETRAMLQDLFLLAPAP